MKKKAILLGVLLLAVVVTAFSVSGTYAKYVSADSMVDEARVAVWGINATTDAQFFSDSYVTEDGIKYIDANNTDHVIAPGAKGVYNFAITQDENVAAPETNYKLTVEAQGYDDTKMLVFSVDGTEIGDIDALVEYLNSLTDGTVYAARTKVTDIVHEITWEWVFEVDDDTNAADTALGNNSQFTSDLVTDAAFNTQYGAGLSISIEAVQTMEEATN